jgi:hypothetical protein
MKTKKLKKQYALESSLAIAVDIAAAKNQVSSSSIVEQALCKYLNLDPNKFEVA